MPQDSPHFTPNKENMNSPQFLQVLLSVLLINRSKVKLFKCPEHLIYDQRELTIKILKGCNPIINRFLKDTHNVLGNVFSIQRFRHL